MTAALLSPPLLIGEEMDFVPRVEFATGSLELDMQRRDYKMTAGNRSTVTVYDSVTEKMRLDAYGYVYHPRFVFFHLGGAAGLIQDYSDTGGRAIRNNHGFNEYDADVTLLPEHPYNLQLFSRQQIGSPMPFSTESMVTNSQGALFRYKQRPYFLHLDAVDTSYERGNNWSEAKQYNAGASYFIGPTANNVGYNRTDTTTSQGELVVRTDAYFNNTFAFSAFSLASGIGSGRQSQNFPAEASHKGTDTSRWTERLNTQLPLNVTVNAEHDYRREVTTTEVTSPSPLESAVFNKTTLDHITITQQLYTSLHTVYYASEQTIQTTGGDQDTSHQSLSFNYSKIIPSGTVRAGYSLQDVESTRKGAAVILSEPHLQVRAPGDFDLINQAVDPSTITVEVKNTNGPYNWVTLQEGLTNNYTVNQIGNTVRITVIRLPSSIDPPPANLLYDFTVSYSLLRNDSQTDTKTKTMSLSFSLFDGLLGPYFSYSSSDLKVISGTFPGGDITSRTTTYGYSVQRKPFLFYLEHTDYESPYNPYRTLRAVTEYRERLNEDTDVYVRLSVNEMTRLATEASKEFHEKTTSTEVTVHKLFPHENLELYFGGDFSVFDVPGITTKNYTLNTTLKWHMGKLDVFATGSKTYSVSSGTSGKQTTEQDSYYLTVSRRIF
jgi:hypothetical protein